MPFPLDLSPLRQALTSLEDSLRVVADEAWLQNQSAAVRNTLFAGVIQNFEFVYELGTKMLRRQIEAETDTPGETDQLGFRDLLRVGAEKGLIGDVEAWFRYRQMRGTTSHTYDLAKAQQVYEGVRPFVADARALLSALERRT
jgi:nucleotidyltransferase substrate binding protein (TIGR01987 family)